MWALIPFIVSLLLMAGYIAFRMHEEKKGFMLFATARAKADEAVLGAYRAAVTKDIPSHFRVFLIHAAHYVTHAVVVLAVQVLRAIERPLARFSYRLRRNIPVANGKAPSDFLTTIKPAKPSSDGESKVD